MWDYKLNLKIIIYFWLFLLMFSNLFDRIMGNKIPTALFYFISFLLIILCLVKTNFNNLLIIVSLLPTFFFSILTFHPSTPIKANIMSIKDFILPIASLWIPISLIKDKREVINLINYFFLIFICYSVFQEISFYAFGGMAGLKKYLPWDYNYVTHALNEPGYPKNLFQDHLLRFFGPMNIFFEGQVFVAIILAVLLKYSKVLTINFIFKINLILGFCFLVFALERTPIFMFMIIMVIWNIWRLSKVKYIFLAGFIIILVIIISIIGFNTLQNNVIVGYAVQRIANIATLQLKEDSAVKTRMEDQWKQSVELLKTSFFGLGPARVSPAAANMIDNYIGPHNNFLAYYLGYGFVGLFLFLLLLIAIVLYASKCKPNTKCFVWGIVASYIACAFFNLPFGGKIGVIFFFIIGFVLSKGPTHKLKILN